MMENKDVFTNKSRDYSLYRPSYPASAIAWLKERIQGERVVDVGAGTGIFTNCLRPYFKDICAVEPNEDMRKEFALSLPDIPCIDGCGENIGLPQSSTNLITVAQAFHWLDEDKFKQEAIRILHPDGRVAIIWNTSLKNDFSIARDEVCQKYCPRFRKGYAGKRTVEEGDAFLRNTYFKEVEFAEFDNPFVMDYNAFIGNIRSRSYAIMPDDEKYDAFIKECGRVFDEYSIDGSVVESQKTTIYLGIF